MNKYEVIVHILILSLTELAAQDGHLRPVYSDAILKPLGQVNVDRQFTVPLSSHKRGFIR